jgi:hypothetical protein
LGGSLNFPCRLRDSSEFCLTNNAVTQCSRQSALSRSPRSYLHKQFTPVNQLSLLACPAATFSHFDYRPSPRIATMKMAPQVSCRRVQGPLKQNGGPGGIKVAADVLGTAAMAKVRSNSSPRFECIMFDFLLCTRSPLLGRHRLPA